MWVCPASPMSMRRYEYIEYESGKVLGEKKYCGLGTTKVSAEIRCNDLTINCSL